MHSTCKPAILFCSAWKKYKTLCLFAQLSKSKPKIVCIPPPKKSWKLAQNRAVTSRTKIKLKLESPRGSPLQSYKCNNSHAGICALH